MYIFRRPMRSEMWPERGMVTNEISAATSTAASTKFCVNPSVPEP